MTAGILTLNGIIIVFALLGLLGLIMHGMKMIFYKEEQLVFKEQVPQTRQSIDRSQEEAEEELVAVIAAASHYALMRWQRPVEIKVVVPLWDEARSSAWQDTGRRDLISSWGTVRGA